VIARCLVAAVAALSATAACAHDYWLEPSSFSPRPADLVAIRMFVGQHLEGESVPRNNGRIVRFDAVSETGVTPVVALDGADPAGLLRPSRSGGIVVAYRSDRASLELPPDKFEEYLKQEGLEGVSEQRARAGESGRPEREVYSRCAKALLAVAGSGGALLTKPVGLTLELVPESDPYALAPGQALGFRLLYEGKPLPDALVFALDDASASAPMHARTDRNGRVRFTLPRAGRWLVKAVHMIRAPGEVRTDADWESFWASVTFSLGSGHPSPLPPS